jgi:sugar lactone lactonase YvrE
VFSPIAIPRSGRFVILALAIGACGGGQGVPGDAGAERGSGGNGSGDARGSGGSGGSTGAAGDAGTTTDGDAGPTPDGNANDGRDGGGGATDSGAGDSDVSPGSDGGGGSDVRLCRNPPPGPATTVTDQVTFLAGVVTSTVTGSGTYGDQDGAMATVAFRDPVSVIVEPTGTLLICDQDNNKIKRVDPASGNASTLTAQAGFLRPFGFAYGNGKLYVDTDFNASGAKSNLTGTIWTIDVMSGAATAVMQNLGRPRGLAALPDGRLVLGDYQNQRVRLLDPAAKVVSDLAGEQGCPGSDDGTGMAAHFATPYGVVVLPDGKSIVVADYDNHTLRAITLAGVVSTFAGTSTEKGTVDGPRLSARFLTPQALAIDAAGNIFVTDPTAHRIRRVATDGTVTTVAGDGVGGFKDGAGMASEFFGEEGIDVSRDGKTLYVADGNWGQDQPYNRLRKLVITP